MNTPSLRLERQLLRAGADLVIGVDEAGRGALAGPVSVGAVAVVAATPTVPRGTRDSKMISEQQRERLRPLVQNWALATAVAMTPAHVITTDGLTTAQRQAGLAALGQLLNDLAAQGSTGRVTIILDGAHNYLQPGLSAWPNCTVRLKVRADVTCSSVAAASILAKTERDRHMISIAEEHPEFGWSSNKGYGTAGHREAIARHGYTAHHRYR